MDIELKEKIPVTEELLKELVSKSWFEIEYLQAQLNNLDDNQVLKQLLSNLVTSYYVFVGGLENLQAGKTFALIDTQPKVPKLEDSIEDKNISKDLRTLFPEEVIDTKIGVVSEPFEPFEYFVDFDEPSGDPLSDEDLYGTNKN